MISSSVNEFLSKKIVRNILLFVMILLAAVSLAQGVRNAVRDSQDFQWDAMKVFSMRINPYDESASMNPTGIVSELGYDEYYLQMEANQFPSLLMLLLPFAPLEPLMARYIWIVCNVIFTAAIILLLRKTFLKEMDSYWFSILSLLMVAGTPYRNQIGVGQHTLFAFCFFLLAVYFSEYREKSNTLVVIFALFVCYFKYTLTVPLVLYFIYKKKYKEIIISGALHVLLTFVGAWWLGDSFINMIIKPLKVASNLSGEGSFDLTVVFGGGIVAYIVALIVMIVLFFIALKLPEGYDSSFMSLLVLWSMVITYHRIYDFFVMIAVAGLFVEALNKPHVMEHYQNTLGGKLELFKYYYIFTMLFEFFVLRLFHESNGSKFLVGTMYYILTLIVTFLLIKGISWKRKINY